MLETIIGNILCVWYNIAASVLLHGIWKERSLLDMDEKRIALLIDSDNISAKYLDYILDKVNEEGIATYRRIYGDWTRPTAASWKKTLLENSLTPIQQFSNTFGKNSTDSALIIDAMDILYSGKVDGFCIVSSDSDFTRLASRLREENMLVIGMGEEKTPQALIEACNKFIYLDDMPKEAAEPVRTNNIINQKTVERRIKGIIQANDQKNKETELGEIGSKLQNRWPDFDISNYGKSSLSELLKTFSSLQLKRQGSVVTVSIKNNR